MEAVMTGRITVMEAYSWGVCEYESEDGGDGGLFTASVEGAVACADADVC